MIKSDTVHSPQNYLELVTGYCYIIHEGTVAEIEKILKENDLELWNYPLSEIGHIIQNDIDVVLVECTSGDAPYIQELRWFEVPKGREV